MNYKFLQKTDLQIGRYSIVPIRFEDRYAIMKWRNEQIYHLRQNKSLTQEDQDSYFSNVISKLFDQEQPNQILFSYLEDGECIGYGGLVHINWVDSNAEISFIMDTKLEKDYFEFHWGTYLNLIEKVAFEELKLHKIFTFAYDLRPRLFLALQEAEFKHEATLKEHCCFEGKFLDVLYHSKINSPRLRIATLEDMDITFQWATDSVIRKYSFNQNEISREEHFKWFSNKINDVNAYYFILKDEEGKPIGSIRIEVENQDGVVSYLIDKDYFGRGFGSLILKLLEDKIKKEKLPISRLVGYVLNENIASINIFKKRGYYCFEEKNSLKFIKEV